MKEESEKAGLKLSIQKTKIMTSGPITSWQIDGETDRFYFLGLHNHCRWWLKWTKTMKLKDPCFLEDSVLKLRRYLANKGPSSQSYGFSISHVWMWEWNCKEGWALKNWCFWNVVLEKLLESPLDCKETKQVSNKGNQSWIFIGIFRGCKLTETAHLGQAPF